MIETQEEHSEHIEYTFGRWIPKLNREPWLWLAPVRATTYEAVEAHVKGLEGDYQIYQIRTCTTVSRLEKG